MSENLRVNRPEAQLRRERSISESVGKLRAMFEGHQERTGHGWSTLEKTHAGDGTPRFRAFIPDEDGYMGYMEHAMFIGAAHITHDGEEKYLVETHFPYGARVTYFWECIPSSGVLLCREQKPEDQEEMLGLAIEATDRQTEYFSSQVRELADAYAFEAYELHRGRHHYEFRLPPLS